MSGAEAAPEIGNALPLSAIPVGTVIHAIELRPGQGAFMARAAGTFAQLVSREGNYAIIKLPSGETRKVLAACKATVGVVGTPNTPSNSPVKQAAAAGSAVAPTTVVLS